MRRHLCRGKRAPQHALPLPNTASKTLRREIKEINSLVVSLAKRRYAGTTSCISFPFYELLGRSCLRHTTDILRFRLPRNRRETFCLGQWEYSTNFYNAWVITWVEIVKEYYNSENSNIIAFTNFVFSYRLNYYYRTFPLIRLDNNREDVSISWIAVSSYIVETI